MTNTPNNRRDALDAINASLNALITTMPILDDPADAIHLNIALDALAAILNMTPDELDLRIADPRI